MLARDMCIATELDFSVCRVGARRLLGAYRGHWPHVWFGEPLAWAAFSGHPFNGNPKRVPVDLNIALLTSYIRKAQGEQWQSQVAKSVVGCSTWFCAVTLSCLLFGIELPAWAQERKPGSTIFSEKMTPGVVVLQQVSSRYWLACSELIDVRGCQSEQRCPAWSNQGCVNGNTPFQNRFRGAHTALSKWLASLESPFAQRAVQRLLEAWHQKGARSYLRAIMLEEIPTRGVKGPKTVYTYV